MSNVTSFPAETPYYRAMMPDPDGLPRIGRSARMLGVRMPEDIAPDKDGMVRPGIGGMSVAPDSVWSIPNHRRPRGMQRGSTGPATDLIFAVIHVSLASTNLAVRLDPNRPQLHAFVEPAIQMEFSTYEANLAETRGDWKKVWP